MPRVQNVSPVTGLPVHDSYIHTTNAHFVDAHGRSILLRGVNLSGSTKAPLDAPTQNIEGFWDTAEAGGESFVGRPLDLDDGSADVHLSRLRGWGFNMLRYVVTWEALEHQGPGLFDFEFMDYTVRVLRRCKDFGFRVYMDPHQDLWSRFSGGSGAPYWTLVACGFEPRNFTPTEATLLHAEYPSAEDPDPASFPAMIWSTNYFRLAVQTVFTMFFAGRDFAPKCIIDGVNIQDYLTSHYITAFGHLADRIRDAGDLLDECVIGWDSLNEPSEGFLGHENLNDFSSEQAMKKGTRPTPAQSLRLGMGMAQTVETWSFGALGPKRDSSVTVDPKGIRAWLDPSHEPDCVSTRWGWTRGKEWKLGGCVWALHDVWDPESGYILIPDYFKCPPFDPTRRVNFVEDYWRPHWRKYSQRLRASHPDCIHFIQPPVFVQPPSLNEDDLKGRACYTPHYYDGLTLVTRHWNWFNADALGLLRGKYSNVLQAVRVGEWAIRKSLHDQLSMFLQDALDAFGPSYPTLIGEIGTPFDMDSKRSYGYSEDGKYLGDFTEQQKALDASLNACDGTNGINWTVWTYCADNTHDWGDGWNLEDLSLWSANDLRFGARHSKNYRMESRRSRETETINDRSNAQLLLTRRASSINLDMDTEDITSHTIRPINPSSSTLSTFPDAVSDQATTGYGLRDLAPEGARSALSFATALQTGAEADNLYEFLTNGARAVGAFARPWPIAVVGVPKDIKFDIGRAEFKMTVRVTADDMLAGFGGAASSTRSMSTDRRQSDDIEKDAAIPTEIYIPLVHYAADPFVRRPRLSDSTYHPSRTPTPNSTSKGLVTSLKSPDDELPKLSHSRSATFESTGATTIVASNTNSTLSFSALAAQGHGDSSSPVWSTWAGRDVPLALDIEASEGSRWEIDGQVLKWWYPLPSPASSSSIKEGDDDESIGSSEKLQASDEERWIRVRRAGGPIKGIGSAEIYIEEEGTSWWDKFCPKF